MKNMYLKILTHILEFTEYMIVKRVIPVLPRSYVNVKMQQLCTFMAYFSERKREEQNGVNAKYVKCH